MCGNPLAVPGPAAASDQRLTPIVKAAQKAKPAVVSIRGEKTAACPARKHRRQRVRRGASTAWAPA